MITTFNHRFHFFLTFFFHYTMFLAVIAVGRFSAKYMTSTTKMKKWKIYKLPMRQLTRMKSIMQ